jgi:hypothetical protein
MFDREQITTNLDRALLNAEYNLKRERAEATPDPLMVDCLSTYLDQLLDNRLALYGR